MLWSQKIIKISFRIKIYVHLDGTITVRGALMVKTFWKSCLKMHHFRNSLPQWVLTPQKKTSSHIFKNIIADSYHLFLYSRKPFATSADVKIVLFALECLVDLVNAKGSVLSIWALDPPIFLLLGTIHILRSQFLGGGS